MTCTARALDVIRYRLDADDRFVSVCNRWSPFAEDNGGTDRVINILGESLWDSIQDRDTRELYRLLMTAVRESATPVTYDYRCDSPTMKRTMRMTIIPGRDRALDFVSETLAIEPINFSFAFCTSYPYNIRNVNICSNCRAVKVEDTWCDITEAFRCGFITTKHNAFLAVYRFCPSCRSKFENKTVRLMKTSERASHRIERVLAEYRAGYLQTAAGRSPAVP